MKLCWSRAAATTTGKSGGANPESANWRTPELRTLIRQEFARSRQTYGSPRLAHVLGCPGRRNRIARLMRQERIFARQRSKYRVATTDSRHGGPIAPNRVRNLSVQQVNQVWATDATGVLTGRQTNATLVPTFDTIGSSSPPTL